LVALQRAAGNRATAAVLRGRAPARAVQRVVELRPPGRGESSAFERADEFVARINDQTPGVRYRLDGRRLAYEVLDAAQVEDFDRRMMAFVDRAEVVPLRLVTNDALVQGNVGFERLLIDSLEAAYVDVDDMMASSDLSFRLNLIHLLEERFAVRDYARRIGTDMSRDFPGAHARGIRAETEHLRAVVGDPAIEFVFEEAQTHGRVVFGYRSRPGRYRIFHVFRPGGHGVEGGEVFAQLGLAGGSPRLTIEELIEHVRAAAAPAGPAPAAPAPVPAAP
jgi:hypothetical protein